MPIPPPPTSALAFVIALLATAVRAEVTVPAIFGSHMVVQRDMPLRVWGRAVPGEEVTVTFAPDRAMTKAGADGRWSFELPPPVAGGEPRSLTVAGRNTLRFDDILVGEVWLGSGQSNMGWAVADSSDAKATIAAAVHPRIRLFHVPRVQSPEAADDVRTSWRPCAPDSVRAFSAVLYHFGETIQEELDVPVGLVDASWGGSRIESWTTHEGVSGGMYNGMIAPLVPFAIRGCTWYQGEAHAVRGEGFAYLDKMQRLIAGWRAAWGDPRLPFYFVQLAPLRGTYAAGALPAIWEAQAAALGIPNTGMVVTTDLVDDITDVHPRNKRDVGRRLALWALNRSYGRKEQVCSGPLFSKQAIEGGSIRLWLVHAAGLSSRDGGPLTEFEIAGEDRQFVPAVAKVLDDTVVVSAAGVPAPRFVRFGWRNDAQPNLVNGAGLPAAPFHTDNWRGGTAE